MLKKTALARTLLLAMSFASSWAWAVDLSQQIEFSIPPQRLSSALLEFSHQAKVQVIAGREVNGLRTDGVSGKRSIRDALAMLLAATPLSYRVASDTSITVGNVDAQSAPETPKKNVTDADNSDVPAQADTESLAVDSTSSRQQSPAGSLPSLEEVIVTGSRLFQPGKQAAVDVRSYGSDQIEQRSQVTLAGFLNTLPEVSVNSQNSYVTSTLGQSYVQLRGLPAGTTLVLLDGHRAAAGATAPFGGTSLFDLNSIPPSAIERVDILPSGSSAVYGSDALAGVVNIILKKRYDGLNANVHYGYAEGSPEKAADVTAGWNFDRGFLTLVGSYLTRDALGATERDITANEDFRTYGGRDTRTQTCNPGTVSSRSGANLPGLNATRAGIPEGINDAPTQAQFSATAGVSNLCNYNAMKDILPDSERSALLVNSEYQAGSALTLRAQLLYSHGQQKNAWTPWTLNNVLLPASNAFNPFGQDVSVTYAFDSPYMERTFEWTADFRQALVGARGPLAGDWTWALDLSDADVRDRDSRRNNFLSSAAVNAALANSSPNSALNVFTSGAPASEALLRTFVTDGISHYRAQTRAANLFVQGPLFQLPAGKVQMAVGGEYTTEKTSQAILTQVPNIFYGFDRDTSSAFTEIRVPVLASRRGAFDGDLLTLSGALRYDRANDFGDNVTPQGGVEFRPTQTLLLRGSFAKAYRAPSLYALGAPHSVSNFSYTVVDPKRAGVVTTAQTAFYGGNADLDAETGRSSNLGLVWSPASLQGLRASLTFWSIDQKNRVNQPAVQTVVDNEDLFPGRVVRGPSIDGGPGAIQSVDISFLNFGALHARGFDYQLRYTTTTALGELTPSIAATQTYRFEAAVTPTAPVQNRLDRANTDAWAPSWKGVVSLDWKKDQLSAGASTRYVSGYSDYSPLTDGSYLQLGNFWITDLHARLESRLSGSTASVTFGVNNVFDSLPRFSAGGGFGTLGYDPSQYDIIGRFAYLNLGVDF